MDYSNLPMMDAETYRLLERAEAAKKEKFIEDNAHLFRRAVREADLNTIKELHAGGMDLQINNNYAIITASENGYEEIVKYLCENKVDVTAQDNSAIIKAGEGGYYYLMHVLIQYGADIKLVDSDDMFEYLIYKNSLGEDAEPIRSARVESDFEKEVSNTGKLIKAVKAKGIKQIKGLKI